MALLDGKVAIVTGAGRGIGREEALLLAKQGAKVVVNDLGGHFDGTGQSRSPAEDVIKEIRGFGGEAVANFESVSDFKSAKRIVECAIDNFGKLNIVVNNAGILRDRMIFNMSEEDFDAVLNVHLKGTFNLARHASAYWREQHKNGNLLNGRLINTSSDSGLLGNAGQGNYGTAKAAVAAFAIIIDREMARYGCTANAIAPVARTRLTIDATPQTAATMPAVKQGEFDLFSPAHVAPLVAWLGSDDAKDVHGEVFRVGMGRVWLMRGWHSVGAGRSGARHVLGSGGARRAAEGRTRQGRHQEGEHGRGHDRGALNAGDAAGQSRMRARARLRTGPRSRRVLIICAANTARSIMAEHMLRRELAGARRRRRDRDPLGRYRALCSRRRAGLARHPDDARDRSASISAKKRPRPTSSAIRSCWRRPTW